MTGMIRGWWGKQAGDKRQVGVVVREDRQAN